MPLFESQDLRNKRVIKDVHETIVQKLDRYLERDEDYRTHSAWVFGGAVAAHTILEAIQDIPVPVMTRAELEAFQDVPVPGGVLKQVWGKGDPEKAWGLVGVFTLAMISRWYRNIDSHVQVPRAKKEEGRRAAATNILYVFGWYSEDRVDQFMGTDVQFNYDRDRIEARSSVFRAEASILVSQVLRACGYPSYFDPTKLTFPVVGLSELATQGGPPDSLNPFELMWLLLSLNAGERAMYSHYKAD